MLIRANTFSAFFCLTTALDVHVDPFFRVPKLARAKIVPIFTECVIKECLDVVIVPSVEHGHVFMDEI